MAAARDVVHALADAGLTVATGESLTAGLLAARLGDVPGLGRGEHRHLLQQRVALVAGLDQQRQRHRRPRGRVPRRVCGLWSQRIGSPVTTISACTRQA